MDWSVVFEPIVGLLADWSWRILLCISEHSIDGVFPAAVGLTEER